MPTKPLERLLFAQGGRCFFCDDLLHPAEASIEHVVALANGGGNSDENCVACCKSLNRLLGSMSLKEKLGVILNQRGKFSCPNGGGGAHPDAEPPEPLVTGTNGRQPDERISAIVADLRRRGTARPRTLKTLSSTIHALFRKEISETEIAALVGKLTSSGIIQVNANRVAYVLPPVVP